MLSMQLTHIYLLIFFYYLLSERLLDLMDKQRQDAVRNEQLIRTTLVNDFEKQMQNTNELWEQRLMWTEQRDNEKVSIAIHPLANY